MLICILEIILLIKHQTHTCQTTPLAFLLNCIYGLNWPPSPSKPCTLVARRISLTSCYITNPLGDCTHPVFISFQSPITTLTFRSHAFRFSVPRVWNSLHISIRKSQSLPPFRRHLKTFYFSQPTPFQLPTLPRISSSAHPDSSKTLTLYKSCT